MRNYIILNGVNSNTITGLLISTLPPITKPKIRTQTEEIDGRDGDIVTKLGYSAYDKIIEIGLYGNFDINEVISYFSTEGTVVFSNEADKYYNYQILDQIDYEKLIRFKTAKVKMHVQPFKYPLQEEQIQVDATVVQASGTDIRLEYTTPNASIETEVEGKSEQEGTPTPDTPQEIKSVSGIGNLFDNDILLNATGWSKNEDGYYTGIALNLYNYIRNNPITGFKENTQYTISNKSYSSISNSNGKLIITYTDNTRSECYIGRSTTETYYSLTTTANKTISNITFDYSNGHTLYIKYIQIEEGTIAHQYVPYGHWLPVKVSNKNLFDGVLELGTISSTGVPTASDSVIRSKYFTRVASSISISYENGPTSIVVYGYDKNYNFITAFSLHTTPTTGLDKAYRIDIPENIEYIKFRFNTGFTTTSIKVQVEENPTATDYIEHQEQTTLIDLNKYDENNNIVGNYEICSIGDTKDLLTIKNGRAKITKNINSTLFNGNTMISVYGLSGLVFSIPDKYSTATGLLYERAKYAKNVSDRVENTIYENPVNVVALGSSSDTLETLKEKFNGGRLYYVLATPEEIELNGDYNIKAYDQVTYMTTEGNIIPVINAKTSGMPNTVVTNIGNIYAKPLITIYGSGDIGVYLNNQHVLQIALGDNESITIDVSKMEAYDKNTKVLMNRLVTGDYMKFLINSGDNTIAFNGTVAGFTMDNYTRWL